LAYAKRPLPRSSRSSAATSGRHIRSTPRQQTAFVSSSAEFETSGRPTPPRAQGQHANVRIQPTPPGAWGSIPAALVNKIFGAHWARKSKLHFESRQVIKHFDISSMQPRYSSDNTNPQSVSCTPTTTFEPIEALEDVRTLFNGNSRPIIRNRYDRPAIRGSNFNGNLTRFTAMFNCVIDKIGSGIKQQISITSDEYALIPYEVKVPTVVFGSSIE